MSKISLNKTKVDLNKEKSKSKKTTVNIRKINHIDENTPKLIKNKSTDDIYRDIYESSRKELFRDLFVMATMPLMLLLPIQLFPIILNEITQLDNQLNMQQEESQLVSVDEYDEIVVEDF